MSQEDFVADANEVCASFSSWSAGKQESFRDALATGDGEAAAVLLIEYERRFDRTLKKIDSLEAPDDDADRKAIDRFLTVGRQQVDLLPDLAAAIEAGDLTLVSGDPRGAVDAIRLSRATLRTIKQNLFFAFAYNTVLIPVAMTGRLNPILAGAAMALSSIFVVTNSLRLRGFKRSS